MPSNTDLELKVQALEQQLKVALEEVGDLKTNNAQYCKWLFSGGQYNLVIEMSTKQDLIEDLER